MRDDAEELDVEAALADLSSRGLVDAEQRADGETAYRLTDTGLGDAITLFGGRDVHNVTAAMCELLQKHGTILGEHNEEVLPFAVMFLYVQRVVYAFAVLLRDTPRWRAMVERYEQELPPAFFEKHSHAFIDLGESDA